MLKNQLAKLSIKIISNGSCQNQSFQAKVNKSNNLIRISYDEVYENQDISTSFQVLSDNSLRITKKGAYSYNMHLVENQTTNFSLNYGGYGVDYKINTVKVKTQVYLDKIEIYAHYKLISKDQSTSTKIYLTAFLGEL